MRPPPPRRLLGAGRLRSFKNPLPDQDLLTLSARPPPALERRRPLRERNATPPPTSNSVAIPATRVTPSTNFRPPGLFTRQRSQLEFPLRLKGVGLPWTSSPMRPCAASSIAISRATGRNEVPER